MLNFLKGKSRKAETSRKSETCKIEDKRRLETKIDGLGENLKETSNNNDLNFESEYSFAKPANDSGRVSGASEESTFSSNQSDFSSYDSQSDDEYNSASERSSILIERSCSNSVRDFRSPIEEFLCDQKIVQFVEDVRRKFLADLDEESRESCEKADLDEMSTTIDIKRRDLSLAYRLIARFVDHDVMQKLSEGEDPMSKKMVQLREDEIKKTVNSLLELLKYRHRFRLSEAKPTDFSREFYLLNGIFTFGHDKQGIPILYISAQVHRRWPKRLDDMFRRYIAWQLDLITNSSHHGFESVYKLSNSQSSMSEPKSDRSGSFVMCFDCNQITYASIDMDFLKFLVILLLNYYPKFCRYCLVKDNPWIFKSIWTLVKTWLPEDAKKNVHMVTAKQLADFIDVDQIPNSMRVNDFKCDQPSEKGKFRYPKNWSSLKDIEMMAEELSLTDDEVAKFKAHVRKVRDEYKKLGAL